MGYGSRAAWSTWARAAQRRRYFHSVRCSTTRCGRRRGSRGGDMRMSASRHSPSACPIVSTITSQRSASARGGCLGPSPTTARRARAGAASRAPGADALSCSSGRRAAAGDRGRVETTASTRRRPTPSTARGAGREPGAGDELHTATAPQRHDPHQWLEDSIDRVVHVHAKEISAEDAARYRGKVRGMLGCACGDGVIDWDRPICRARPDCPRRVHGSPTRIEPRACSRRAHTVALKRRFRSAQSDPPSPQAQRHARPCPR